MCSTYGHVQYRAVACIHGLIPTRLVHFQKPIKPWSALDQSLFMVIEFLLRRRVVRSLPFQSRIFMWALCWVRQWSNYWLCVYFKTDLLCGYLLFSHCDKHVSGPTEFLKNLQEIVELFLPLDKLKLSYTDVNSAKNFILNHVTFCQSHIDVSLWYQMLQWQVPSLVVQQFKFTVL